MTRMSICALLAVMWIGTSASADPLSSAENTFATRLYRRLAREPGNVAFSPFSVHVALGMLASGAAGDTADQMRHVLNLPADPALADRDYGRELEPLEKAMHPSGNDSPPFQFSFANHLWVSSGQTLRNSFEKTVRITFRAAVGTIDFAGAPDAARDTINQWVSDKTAGQIPDLFGPDNITSSTRMVLANAVYLKCAWLESFSTSATTDAPFHLADKDLSVPMMHTVTDCYAWYEDDSVCVMSLPFKGWDASMLIVLPRKNDGLAAVEKTLDGPTLQRWRSGSQSASVKLALPRFKLRQRSRLDEPLRSMGLSDAFTPKRADFSGISTTKDFFLSNLVHEAMIDVDEHGATAAAASGVELGTAPPPPHLQRTFTADHPFLFLIQTAPNGQILFAGRVSDPRIAAKGA